MSSPAARRLLLVGVTLIVLVVALAVSPLGGADQGRERGDFRALVSPASSADAAGGRSGLADAAEQSAGKSAGQEGTDGHDHDHGDPSTKNDLSRAGVEAGATDPTTAAEAEASEAYVAQGRESADPALTTARLRAPRNEIPEDRFAMAGGCYDLAGVPTTFQATDLGSYLLYGPDRRFLGAGLVGDATWQVRPSRGSDWTVTQTAGGFTFRLADGRALRRTPTGFASGATPTAFPLRTTTGCAAYPEVEVNVDGPPHAGVSPLQEVRGYVDAHTHGMAYEFLGGEVHCGKPWDRYGAAHALVDCEDHTLSQGKGAVLESILSGEPSHDPVGWPTFEDWPAPNSLTHEGTYHRWMERAWRGGERIFVNLLVENGQLCKIYPLKRNSCDEMTSVRLQAQRMREFERYIDAQYGGPGEGWYRIVTSPAEARRVINEGKLAVVMGIETSVPFGCTFKRLPPGDVPACDVASIDRQLDEMYDLGVRQMEIVNKFDNALTGVAGDAGEVGVAVNSANFLETASFWDMRHCEPPDGESADRTQLAVPEISAEQQDALFGAVAQISDLVNLPSLPFYPPPLHCNARGLTDLGAHLVNAMADKQMLIDPDHMSVKARNRLLDILEERDYPGVLSSHSWATPDAYPRIYEMGGFVAPYAGDSEGFLAKWQRHVGWADPRYYFGIGFGADMNGLGAQGDPRSPDESADVDYPFTGLGGVTVDQQVSGERVYDINVDGVSHYGLYPDWVEDLRVLGGEDGAAITEDLARGAEAYLQTWERATGIAPDACRNPGRRLDVAAFREVVRRGMTSDQVLRAVGQPFTRLGSTYGTCARTAGDDEVSMEVTFDGDGRVSAVRRAD